ncbi:hypothetical protein BDV96DRAFT_601591 [Lophiotrema nucula]|uniref:Aconitase A/isopropylmalate dehydratase small subunit swivel domain-containing protein n=1 Tax=Lophiotrema nucula TaxID=690887 RepID=A0A6A5Z304_9PLEO|nr:hypothetical protein BDV96DRAFT_601591 [Lophiotrema nucula]
MQQGEATISDKTIGLQNSHRPSEVIQGRIMRLGDFIDTDATAYNMQVAPSKFLASCTTNEALGAHCMEFFLPDFRKQVKDVQNIIVAGSGFGCGSSREVAVNALLGAGVQNQPNVGLLGATITDDRLFELAQAAIKELPT